MHYRVPKRVDPVRISHTVKKNMLKENAMYQKDDSSLENADVNLTSKDMEVNFSIKQDDDDEIETRITPSELGILGGGGTDKEFVNKRDTMDTIEEADLQGPVAGVLDDIKMMDKVKILEETKDQRK